MNDDRLTSFAGRPLAAATRGLTVRYGATDAVAGLDLAVPAGSVYVLVGPNGAGKTTTIRALLGLVRPLAGEAVALGLPLASRAAEARARIGWVPETTDGPPKGLAVARLLAHHARFHPAWDAAYAERLSHALDLPLDRPYGALSKGQARRVQLVLALAPRPDLLLLDEPTDGLDPLVRDRVLELLAEHLSPPDLPPHPHPLSHPGGGRGAPFCWTTPPIPQPLSLPPGGKGAPPPGSLAGTGGPEALPEPQPTTVILSTHRVHEVEGLGDVVGVIAHGRLAAQLDRSLLAARLHRFRAEVPSGWTAPADLAADVLRRTGAGGGREVAWTIWGEPAEVAARLTAAGATVRAVEPLNLEQATLALLAAEEVRP